MSEPPIRAPYPEEPDHRFHPPFPSAETRLLATLCMEVEATVTAEQLRENPGLQQVLKTAETRCVREYRGARSFEDVVTRIREARRQEEDAKDAAYRHRAADIHALWGAIDALGWTLPEAAAHLGITPDYLRRQLYGFGRARGAELRNWLGRLHEIAFEAQVEREHTPLGGTS